MESLPAPIHKEFEEHGNWVVLKTTDRFSSIQIDQTHEQNNDLVKRSGSAVGLTNNPSAVKKWMIAGPEQGRLLKCLIRNTFQKTVINNNTMKKLCLCRIYSKSGSGAHYQWDEQSLRHR